MKLTVNRITGEIIDDTMPEDWFVYMLQDVTHWPDYKGGAGDRTLYVGITNDVYQRMVDHNMGKARATKGRTWLLVAYARCNSRHEAAMWEQWLKDGDTRRRRWVFVNLCAHGPTLTEEMGKALRSSVGQHTIMGHNAGTTGRRNK